MRYAVSFKGFVFYADFDEGIQVPLNAMVVVCDQLRMPE